MGKNKTKSKAGASKAGKKDEAVPMEIEEKKTEEKKEDPPLDPRLVVLRDIKENIELVKRGVVYREPLFVSRALRPTNVIRRKITCSVVADLVSHFLPDTHQGRKDLLQHIVEAQRKLKEPEDMSFLHEERKREEELEAEEEAAEVADAAAKAKAEEEKLEDEKTEKLKEKNQEKETDKEVRAREERRRAREALFKRLAEKEKRKNQRAWEAKEMERRSVDGALPEVEMYLGLLTIVLLNDLEHKEEAHHLAARLVDVIRQPAYNRRTLDLISRKIFYYFALTSEKLGRLSSIRNTLLELHRTACLRHDEPGQITLTNAILRNYIEYNLYGHADKFHKLNTELPEWRSNSEHARYLYYLGKINSVQLHYSQAFKYLTQAIRKAPRQGVIGFRQAATKLCVIVQMLMGEIPERGIFRQPDLARSLRPYFQLTKAVRVGDLKAFKEAMQANAAVFRRDKTYSLIVRLRHNVIKTGLRKINLSYSRISLSDICDKLNLESVDSAEYIVAKAISDGVIDAVIDREKREMYSKENVDVYSTTEPQTLFHKRIEMCMEIHNGAVKALRFPPDYHKKKYTDDLDDED